MLRDSSSTLDSDRMPQQTFSSHVPSLTVHDGQPSDLVGYTVLHEWREALRSAVPLLSRHAQPASQQERSD